MIRQVAIMYAVAALLLLVGAGCLLLLLRPGGAARAYVLRMTGIMALAAGVMLAAGAGSMQRWSVAG
ncbi:MULTISPECIES: hypothetical protein [unclassified Sphingomonas]|jgi:hypothetical protein|uniref:hypothetical protein n=1 Tax=unclassified Sphingomonas TaxID=196159 RepID=UPI000E107A5C|nr:hypothetical protein [Sphingomonas sp. FARSPH]AXJ95858.1 hypothetical protein DM480_10395 [Sphingomonas sp. FARSPH]